ncbi:hypothetical protein [Alteromonas antoniana]|nr:hypothetical protein [Alteromonas antoniana]
MWIDITSLPGFPKQRFPADPVISETSAERADFTDLLAEKRMKSANSR